MKYYVGPIGFYRLNKDYKVEGYVKGKWRLSTGVTWNDLLNKSKFRPATEEETFLLDL